MNLPDFMFATKIQINFYIFEQTEMQIHEKYTFTKFPFSGDFYFFFANSKVDFRNIFHGMSFYLKCHVVKKGETLKQIAELYEIPDIELLKYFHYQHAPKDGNHLGTSLFAGQEIFIPDQEDIRTILEKRNFNITLNNIKHQDLIKNGNLVPDFRAIDHAYIVEIKDISETKTDHTQFEVLLRYVDKSDSHYIFKFRKEKFLLNGESPDLKVYDLTSKCTSLFYDAEVGIDKNGLLSHIHNYRELYSKWKTLQQNLCNLYEDPLSLQYIDEINAVIENRDLMAFCMSKEIFFQFYLSVYFKRYSQGKSENVSNFFFDEIQYENSYEIDIDDELIMIKQESESIDKYGLHESFGNIKSTNQEDGEGEVPESAIKAQYFLDKNKKILQKAEIKVESLGYETKEIHIHLK